LERRLKQAQREGLIESDYLGEQIGQAAKAGVINKTEAAELADYHDKVASLLAVDDFAPEDLSRVATANNPAATPAPAKPAKKAAKNKAAAQKVARKKVTKEQSK